MSGQAVSQTSSSGSGTVALVLGIVGFFFCPILCPFAWYFGRKELRAVESGESDPSNGTPAKVGMIFGIIGTILMIVSVLVGILILVAFIFIGIAAG